MAQIDIWADEIVKEYKDKGLDAANELGQRIANDNKLKLFEKIALQDKVLAAIKSLENREIHHESDLDI